MKTTAKFEENGFVELLLSEGDSITLLGLMKDRVRRITHLEKAGPQDFAEMSRLARLCYAIADSEKGVPVTIPHLSREDLESMYVLPFSSLDSSFLNALNDVRLRTRTGGPVDPVMADRMAKSLVEVMLDRSRWKCCITYWMTIASVVMTKNGTVTFLVRPWPHFEA